MEGTLDQYIDDIRDIKLKSLTDLDALVSEQFDLPLRPYSIDIRAALELVAWSLEKSESTHFELFRYEDSAVTGIPFVASFESDVWGYGATVPLAICQAALYKFKRFKVTIAELAQQDKP